jgi:hypothetical protein
MKNELVDIFNKTNRKKHKKTIKNKNKRNIIDLIYKIYERDIDMIYFLLNQIDLLIISNRYNLALYRK